MFRGTPLLTNRTKAVIVLAAATFLLTATAAYFPAASAISYRLSDNFAHDTSLNSTLWKVNGVAGNATDPLICSNCNVTAPNLSFSSGGMKVAGAKLTHEILTIQSKSAFTLPITAQANLTGLLSHGNAFIFALASKDGSRGMALEGNLNSTNGGTGYGIDVLTGANSTTTHWQSHAKLYSTPSTNVQYTLRIQVFSNGTASATVSSGSTVLGHASYLIGPGPYYVLLGQSEPLPPGPALAGANIALWRAVNVQ